MEQKLKQRICIEFCVKLQISATETFEMLNKAFPNDAPKRTTVFEWHSRFKAGRISIEDDPRQGRPKFQRTDENVQKITDLIKENPRTTLLELEQDTGISKTTIGRIVTEDLKLKKTPAKFIPRFLTNEQKLCRLATCEDMMEMTRTDPEWKDKIITGDETWVYGYDPETKPQSAEWRGKRFEKKRPEKWTNGGWILHHDNARPHTAHLMTSFLAKNGTQILLQPPYFPDIAPNDFFLFPKLKAVLKGRHFDTRDDIIEKSPLALKSIPKEAYKNCFDNWEKRWRWSESECDKGRKRLREPGNPDLDKCVLKWFEQARDKKIPVSGHLIRSKAEQFATEMGKTDFKASSGWLDGFKERNKISFKTICGESGAVNLQVAEQWKNNLQELIQDKDARDVFNEEDEENADDIIAETMPSVDGWDDVISNPTISYNDFLNADDDVAVCGEITDADIIAEVLNHNIEKQDGDEASGDEDESSVAGEMNVPSAAEATNYIMQLRRFFESKNDKAKTVPSAGKVMVFVFWDSEGVLLLDILNKGQTITANYYANFVNQLRETIKEKRRGMLYRKIVYLQDNAPSHRSLQAMAAIYDSGFELLPHAPYSPYLAPSDFQIFPHLKISFLAFILGQMKRLLML
ncbi:hypothetical protein LAZ67_6002200 [Cordylochernes scorpioides]|uniref:HTH CENPB-type domain-containing protein n=1 Tax=Cordylochernes scorpioides TaxID=51811 RepID=A0ABY6KMT2_9ARAC|nr:hypothetical protein LAZ67_6002200 [Cordylochernes scorpioides]